MKYNNFPHNAVTSSVSKWSYFRTSVFTMMNNRIVQPILNKGRVRENKPKSVSICC